MTCKGHNSQPVLVVCPVCQPGSYSYAGVIISRTCDGCVALQQGQTKPIASSVRPEG